MGLFSFLYSHGASADRCNVPPQIIRSALSSGSPEERAHLRIDVQNRVGSKFGG